MRRFLAEFLWDPRVVQIPRPIWWLILHGFILRTRPAEVAHKYRKIWTEAGSPLRAIGERQALALEQALGDGTRVEFATRYGEPSIAAGIRELEAAGATRIVVLPLYPQYSSTTTESTYDALAAARPHVPVERVRDYHDHPLYIAALAASVRDDWAAHGRGERLLMSFHGVPERYLRNGDTYVEECRRTARLLADALSLGDGEWALSFQSRFGRERWVQPYTDATVTAWGREGLARVDVVCPGFAADCLETLEEIAILNREIFVAAGGRELHYIPALNDRPDHIDALRRIVQTTCSVAS